MNLEHGHGAGCWACFIHLIRQSEKGEQEKSGAFQRCSYCKDRSEALPGGHAAGHQLLGWSSPVDVGLDQFRRGPARGSRWLVANSGRCSRGVTGTWPAK